MGGELELSGGETGQQKTEHDHGQRQQRQPTAGVAAATDGKSPRRFFRVRRHMVKPRLKLHCVLQQQAGRICSSGFPWRLRLVAALILDFQLLGQRFVFCGNIEQFLAHNLARRGVGDLTKPLRLLAVLLGARCGIHIDRNGRPFSAVPAARNGIGGSMRANPSVQRAGPTRRENANLHPTSEDDRLGGCLRPRRGACA